MKPRVGGERRVAGDVRRVASLLDTPKEDFARRLRRAAAGLERTCPEAADQVWQFADDLRDLGQDELRELHAGTFAAPDGAARTMARLLDEVVALAPGAQRDALGDRVLPVLHVHLQRLEALRNPYAHVIKAAYCLLLPLVR